jgi:HD-GYP domain-containing protein (c-di-GMP phosphodiesterase class II)
MPPLHAQHVSELSGLVAARLELDRPTIERVKLGGWLRDVGKITVPERLLRKPGPLLGTERDVVRAHAAIGAEIVRYVPQLAAATLVVRHHHERFDGEGYPDRLEGGRIPLEARIVACADAFVAITSDRPYQRARSRADAIAELRRAAGSQLDPEIVEAAIAELRSQESETARRLLAAQATRAA